MVEHSGVPEGACAFCERPKSIVICSGCRHVVPNVRHRRTCTEHPRVISKFLSPYLYLIVVTLRFA